MMTGGGWDVAMRPAEEIQPPFTSTSWLDLIQGQFSPLCKKSHLPTTYEDLMHNNLASWLNRINEIVGIWEWARW
eukprot:scaffold240171_cov36-Cyclotella_meneghiniana.AAC.2